MTVVRRSVAWLFALPLIFAGSQVAHVVAYRLVYPSSELRLRELLSTGHGYMEQMPLVLGIAGAVAAVSLLVGVLDAARGRRLRALPAWSFALLPLASFTLQEILERSLHAETLVWRAVESPTFLPGLLLQLPFALLAYLIARLLLRAAEEAGRQLASRPAARVVWALVPGPVTVTCSVRAHPLALRLAKRGPPRLLLA
jgi:hypothetical protein